MFLELLIYNLCLVILIVYIIKCLVNTNKNIYLLILAFQIMNLTISILEIINGVFVTFLLKASLFIVSILIPSFIYYINKQNIVLTEIFALLYAKMCIFFGDADKAKKEYIKICAKYERSYMGHKNLGYIYENIGEKKKAVDEYVKAIEVKKDDYRLYYNIAVLLDDLGKKSDSVMVLNNLLRMKPDYLAGSDLLGIILSEQGKYLEARRVYEEALKYNSNNYQLFFNLGIVYTQLNDFENAKNFYKKALSINPSLHEGYFSLGQIYLYTNNISEAENYFKKSILSDELKAKSQYQLAKIYIIKGEKGKCISSLEQVIAIDDTYKEKMENDILFRDVKDFVKSVNMIKNSVYESKKERKNEENRINSDRLEKFKNTINEHEATIVEKLYYDKQKEIMNENTEEDTVIDSDNSTINDDVLIPDDAVKEEILRIINENKLIK